MREGNLIAHPWQIGVQDQASAIVRVGESPLKYSSLGLCLRSNGAFRRRQLQPHDVEAIPSRNPAEPFGGSNAAGSLQTPASPKPQLRWHHSQNYEFRAKNLAAKSFR
ncbi:hypothetical protein [Cypionkella sp.]|uniref:hypothetical protein n=1 Tax=Cypionkella sp. TaxID=2811411 RepID=UPI00262A10DF|nr:hypothetical protein [Cypionkella sp.]